MCPFDHNAVGIRKAIAHRPVDHACLVTYVKASDLPKYVHNSCVG